MNRFVYLLTAIIASAFLLSFNILSVKASVPAASWVQNIAITGRPNGLAIDTSGNIYVTDYDNHRVYKYSGTGTLLGQFGSNGSGNGQFNRPEGIAVDGNGNIYVTETGSTYRVQKFNSSFTWQWTITGAANGGEDFSLPQGVAVDNSGRVFVMDSWNYQVQVFNSSDGSFIRKFGTRSDSPSGFGWPIGITLDGSGNLLISDISRRKILRYTPEGSFLSTFGTAGTLAGQFGQPRSVFVDNTGKVWVADSSSNRIQPFSSGYQPLTPFGSSGSGNGQFSNPCGIVVNSSGEIFVADKNNYRVQKFNFAATDYQVSNVTAGLNIINTTTYLNVESTSASGINNAAANLRLQNDQGITISDITVNMTADRNWSTVSVGADRATGRSFVSNLIGAPGASATHTLYIPVPAGRTSASVYICPNATSLADVTDSCAGGVERTAGSYTESFGNITVGTTTSLGDGIAYWTVAGITGSGGLAYDLVEFSGSGSGTGFDPYIITTCTELQEMKDNRDASYLLANDIDCSDTINWNGGVGFEAVGTYPASPFTGSLDGDSFTITGLYENRPSFNGDYEEDAMGLFGYAIGASFTNINLENVTLNGVFYVGALVGHMTDSIVDNCTSSGNLGQGEEWAWAGYFGGLIGGSFGTSEITNSSSSVAITYGGDAYYMGGFIGQAEGTTILTNNSASGDIEVGMDPYQIGGFVGYIGENYATDVTIDNCFATGNIHTAAGAGYGDEALGGDGYWIGGFGGWVGENDGYARATITNSYATGSILAEGNDNYWYGGFIGWILGDSEIYDSYATGAIDAMGDDNYWMGGFIGQIGGTTIIEDTYATGNVTAGYAGNGMGGYAGWIEAGNHGTVANISITRSYATGDVSVTYEAYGVGGFVGWMGYGHLDPVQQEAINISYSYSTGDISVGTVGKEAWWSEGIGGFAGFMLNASTEDSVISNSFSTGKIDTFGNDIESVGGFVGEVEGNITFDQCASLGEYVEGSLWVGGFIGQSYYRSGWFGSSSGYLKLFKDSYTRSNVITNYIDPDYPTENYAGTFAGYSDSENAGADSVFENSYGTGTISVLTNPVSGIDTTLSAPLAGDEEVTTMSVTDASGIVPGTYLLLDEYEGTPYSTTLAAPVAIGAEYVTVTDASGLSAVWPDNQVIFEKGVVGKEDGPYQIWSINVNTLRFYSGSYNRPAIAHDAGTTVTYEPWDMREIVLVQQVNGNDLTVTREIGNTTANDHEAGATVRTYTLPDIADMETGGFIGYSTGTVTDSYWNTDTSGLLNSEGGTGLTTAQMQQRSSYPNWDFESNFIWGINEQVNDNYPFLDFDDPTLSGLGPSLGTLEPAFNRNVFEYTLTVPLDTATISFTPNFFRSDPYLIRNADVDGTPVSNGVSTGDIALPDPITEISFTLESLSWRQATYTINVVKGDVPTPTPTPSNPTPTPTNPTPIVTTAIPTPTSRPRSSVTPPPLCLYEYQEQCINELLITEVTTTVNGNSALICWKTNIPSDDFINYSKQSGTLDLTTELIEEQSTFCQTLSDLEYDQEYIFLINASQGEMEATHEGTFRTGSLSLEPVYSCAIYANPLSAKLEGNAITMNFTTDNADSCTVSWGEVQSVLDLRADLNRSGQKFSSYIMLGDAMPSAIYYRIACSSGTNQCTSSNRISLAGGVSGPVLDFFGMDLNFGPFEFIALTGLVLTITPISIAFPQFWLYGIAWIFPKKKQRPWGIVYDVNTKNPIAFAVVRLFDQGGNMLKQVVTDLQGRFSFLADPGTYQLSVEHSDYNKVFKNMSILKEDSKIAENIGLVALEENKPLLASLRSSMGTFFMKTYWVLGFLGMLFSFVAMVSNFEIINLLIFIVYVVQMIMMIALRPKRDFGFVYNTLTGERIKGAFVQVQDVAQGRQVDVQMSDERGRFGFNLDQGEYILIVKVGEQSPRTSDLQSVKLADGSMGYKYDSSIKGFSFGF